MRLIIRDSLLCSCRAPTLNADGAEFSWAAPIAQLEEGCGYLFKKALHSQTIRCRDLSLDMEVLTEQCSWCSMVWCLVPAAHRSWWGSGEEHRQAGVWDENIPDKSFAGTERRGLRFSTLEAFRLDAPECWLQLAMARWALCAQPNTEREAEVVTHSRISVAPPYRVLMRKNYLHLPRNLGTAPLWSKQL